MRNKHYQKIFGGSWVLILLCLVAFPGITESFFHKPNQPAVSKDLFKKLKIERPSERLPAPDFTLADLNKKQITLSGLKGKVVFLNFWATWCAPCVQEMPTMERLHQELGPKGLVVLAVNYQEDAKDVKEFFSKHKLTFTALLDFDANVAESYRTWGLPMTVIVNKRGELVGKAAGPRDWHSKEAREFFEQLLAEQP
jgi:thiol-disulfide isomerase/thioredoxin